MPSGQTSGLDVAIQVVKNLEDIAICKLSSKDVVRHPLVQRIVKAYEDYEKKTNTKKIYGFQKNVLKKSSISSKLSNQL